MIALKDSSKGSRVKLLRVHRDCFLDLLRQDGSKAFKIKGIPDDAIIVGVYDDPVYSEIQLRV